jgi:hypothetical protein
MVPEIENCAHAKKGNAISASGMISFFIELVI